MSDASGYQATSSHFLPSVRKGRPKKNEIPTRKKTNKNTAKRRRYALAKQAPARAVCFLYKQKKSPCGLFFFQDLISSLCPPFLVTIPAKKLIKTFWVWLKWKLSDWIAAIAALPVTLVHLPFIATAPLVICHFALYL